MYKEFGYDTCLGLFNGWSLSRRCFFLFLDIGSTLARMVLRYQMKSAVEEGAASGSDGSFSEQLLDKFAEWTFIPESYMDSVFGQSDDLDSEGIYYKKNNSLYVLKPLHTDIEK